MYRRLEHGRRARAYRQNRSLVDTNEKAPSRSSPGPFHWGLLSEKRMNENIHTYPLLLIQEWLAIGLYVYNIGPGLIFQSRWLSIKIVAGFHLRNSSREREVLDGLNRQHIERGIRI